MIYTYVIQSEKDKRWYTGFTGDLRKRFKEHNDGKSLSTKGRGPFKLVYYEACIDRGDARMKKNSGFTLIEFVMIIAIGSFLVAGIVLFTRQQIVNGVNMRDFLIASNLAKLKMAEMNNTTYASLPAGTTTLPAEPSFSGFAVQRVISTIATSGTITLRQINVLVDYTGGSFSNPLVQLITYRQSSTTFGDGV